MLKIGNLHLKSNIILAPMAGITDLPFRMLNRRFGCELAFVEMINVRSVSYNSKRTKQMLSSNEKDRPLGIQILGNEPKFILKALDVLKGYAFDVLDFNAACPVKKVIRRGEGAALLKSPKKLAELLKMIVSESAVPVTVKIRTGWDKDTVNARDVALSCQDAGVSAVFIHGRTKDQGYSGAVDYKAIELVKKALDIPVVASGDILSCDLAKKMFEETGCDGILAARGALGNPWFFKDYKPEVEEIAKIMLEHLEMCVDFYGERAGVVIFRKFFSWYTKGFRRIRPLREKISHLKKQDDVAEAVKACGLMGKTGLYKEIDSVGNVC